MWPRQAWRIRYCHWINSEVRSRAGCRRVRLRGIECETASDPPRVGLARVEEEPFKVVLLDIVMLEMDGLEVLRQLKAKYHEVEVVMMTANSTLDRVARARES